MSNDPIQSLLDEQRCVVLDGAMGTELERRGHDLSDDLWSARILLAAPDVVAEVHRDYLNAGADVLVSCSYQATLQRFEERGVPTAEATRALQRSVTLATEVRDRFWATNPEERQRPLVAASVGPYGAYLADGSEFSGDYELEDPALRAFHSERWRILADAGADLIACETIPSLQEARILAQLIDASGGPAWVSFSARDDAHLSDGTAVEEAVRILEEVSGVVAVGFNCTAPQNIAGLLRRARETTSRPLLVYPNSGEQWDARARGWTGSAVHLDRDRLVNEWFELGARLIGGCCRTTPEQIGAIRRALAV